MTFRNSTERHETVELVTNELIGSKIDAIRLSLEKMFSGDWKSGAIPHGQTRPQIVATLNQLLTAINTPALTF